MIAGLITLAGWLFDIPRLTDWWNDGISMLFNTALACALTGLALLLGMTHTAWARTTWTRRVVQVLGVVVAALGGVTLLQHLTGLDLHVDALVLSRNWGQNASVAPMRMGPPAATSFLLLGCGVFLTTGARKSREIAAMTGLAVLVIASLSIIGYLFGADQLFGVARFTGIARQTGYLLALLAMGLLAAVPEVGLVAALRRDDVGGLALRYLLAPTILLPVMLGAARLAGQEANLYDTAFGTAALILIEVILLVSLLWMASRAVSIYTERARDASLRLAAIVTSTGDAVIGKSLTGTIETWNEGATELFGYTAEETIGKNIRMLIPSDRLEEEDEIQRRLRNGERTQSYETVRLHRDGRPVHVSLTVSPIFDSFGGVLGASSIARDVTMRTKAEAALRRNEAELKALADSIPQLAWIAGPDGHIFWYNQQWYDYTGATHEQMEGWGWQSVHDPEVLPRVLEQWKQSLTSGEPFEMEFPLRGADGAFRWFLTRCRPIWGEDGQVRRWFGTNTDMEELKRKEQALERKTRVLELLNHAGRLIGGKLELRELMQSVIDLGVEATQAEYGAFFYSATNEDGDPYLLYTMSGADREQLESFGVLRATPLFGPTFAGNGVVRSSDLGSDPLFGSLASDNSNTEGGSEARSYLTAPVKARTGEVLGGLFFGHPHADQFSEETERIVEGIAAQAGVAVDNARLYDNLRQAGIERESLLEAERSARAEAERLNVMKDEFLATLSHELRTPLTAILGWTQILSMEPASEEDLREGLETIERNARAQTQLIEDLLDMSRIISGKIRLASNPVDIVEILSQTLETVRPTADAKQVNLEQQLPAKGAQVQGDAVRLQQVFWNLLSNAIKFTPGGGRVGVTARYEDGRVEIGVQDSGIGIPAEQLEHIFERFRQVDSSTTRTHGGLGLGLSIVKNLVELHGGEIQAQSEGADQGATFLVTLPLLAARHDGARTGRPESADDARTEGELSGARVLVVEDETDSRALIVRVLKQCDASIDAVGSADEALRLMQSRVPDAIVSDIGMPGIDGYEFIRRVRTLSPDLGGETPAVALTAFARDEDRQRAVEAGFDAHMRKPLFPRELIDTLSELIKRTGR